MNAGEKRLVEFLLDPKAVYRQWAEDRQEFLEVGETLFSGYFPRIDDNPDVANREKIFLSGFYNNRTAAGIPVRKSLEEATEFFAKLAEYEELAPTLPKIERIKLDRKMKDAAPELLSLIAGIKAQIGTELDLVRVNHDEYVKLGVGEEYRKGVNTLQALHIEMIDVLASLITEKVTSRQSQRS